MKDSKEMYNDAYSEAREDGHDQEVAHTKAEEARIESVVKAIDDAMDQLKEGRLPWRNKHHVWCNRFMYAATGCEQCKTLFVDYPYETDEELSTLLERHFPNATEREET